MISYEMSECKKESIVNGELETWRSYTTRGTFNEVKAWRNQHTCPDGAFIDGDWKGMIINLDWKFPDRLWNSRIEAAEANAEAILKLKIKKMSTTEANAKEWKGRIRSNGNSQVITVPSATMTALNLTIGDEINIRIWQD